MNLESSKGGKSERGKNKLLLNGEARNEAASCIAKDGWKQMRPYCRICGAFGSTKVKGDGEHHLLWVSGTFPAGTGGRTANCAAVCKVIIAYAVATSLSSEGGTPVQPHTSLPRLRTVFLEPAIQ